MRNLILAAAFLLPSTALAVQAVEVNARSYSCNQIAQIIRQSKAVFVRIGIGGRSFRYPPATCYPGNKRVTTRFRDGNGQLCILDYACDYDPESIYNRID